jgi:CheY-like chemotaxis protein
MLYVDDDSRVREATGRLLRGAAAISRLADTHAQAAALAGAAAARARRARGVSRPRVLVVADYHLPGFRAGGPIRAIGNSIRALAGVAEFFVVTRDHDTDGVPYDLPLGQWLAAPAAEVWCASASSMCPAHRTTPIGCRRQSRLDYRSGSRSGTLSRP